MFLLICHPQQPPELGIGTMLISQRREQTSQEVKSSGSLGRLAEGPELSPGSLGSPLLPPLPNPSALESYKNQERYNHSLSLTLVTECQVLVQGMDDPRQ